MVLVCFAVKEEARPFQRACAERADVRVLLTGMGRVNAENAIRAALRNEKPKLVLTCGFAGGLRPGLEAGAVLYDANGDKDLEQHIETAGARKGRFAFSDRVATTASEKRALWEQTNADAVEMESHSVCAICREHRIPSAIVRVVLDTAEEDLPLDFNKLMTADYRMSYAKLMLALAKSPRSLAGLLRLREESAFAAQKLAAVLTRIIVSLSAATGQL